MFFKLSAREIEILEERDKILERLRQGQDRRTRPLKPPILVVPQDESHLMAVIERCQDFPDVKAAEAAQVHQETTEPNDRVKVSKRKSRNQAICLIGEGSNLLIQTFSVFQIVSFQTFLARLLQFLRSVLGFWRQKLGGIRQPTHNRQVIRHRRRLKDGLALSINGAMLSATGPIIHVGYACAVSCQVVLIVHWMQGTTNTPWFFNLANPMVKDMEHTLTVKCDVCVLSNYNQVIRQMIKRNHLKSSLFLRSLSCSMPFWKAAWTCHDPLLCSPFYSLSTSRSISALALTLKGL